MRITRDILLNLARENAAKFAAKDRGLVCIYLTGSLIRTDEPFIGGVTDIDLICVHDRPITAPREIVRINSDVHLDIAHYTQDDFNPARKLRLDPWIGGALDFGAVSLQDSEHWFDLMRSNVVSQFWAPANVASRSQSFLKTARRNWQDLEEGNIPQGIKRISSLLDAIRATANSVAVINGMPLPVRRLFLELPERAQQVGLPDLTGDLVGLFTSEMVNDDQWKPWLTSLTAAFEALKEVKTYPLSIHPNRRNYFEKAISIMSEARPASAVWVLLDIWTMLASVLPKASTPYKEWQTFIRQLNLDAKTLPSRLEALDGILDQIEEVVEGL